MESSIPEKQRIAYIFWLVFGVFGGHRFYLRKVRTGAALLSLSIMQLVLIEVTFSKPHTTPWVYFLWPPYSAYENLKLLFGFIFPQLSGRSPDPETALASPALWILTLPATVATIWTLIDGALIAQWVHPSRSDP